MTIESFEQYVEQYHNDMHFQAGFTQQTAAQLFSIAYKNDIQALLDAHKTIASHFTIVYSEKGFQTSVGEIDGKAAEKLATFGTVEAWKEGWVPEQHWSTQYAPNVHKDLLDPVVATDGADDVTITGVNATPEQDD